MNTTKFIDRDEPERPNIVKHMVTMNNELENEIEKFVLTPAMARLFSAETLLMVTGRLGEYEGKTVREELKDLLASERAKIREEVELMPCYLVDARFNPDDPEKMIDTLSRDEVLAKLTPEV